MRPSFLFGVICETLYIVIGVVCFCVGLYLVTDPDGVIKNIGVDFKDARENINNMTKTIKMFPGLIYLKFPNYHDYGVSNPLHDTNFRDFVKVAGLILTLTGFIVASIGTLALVATLRNSKKLDGVCVAASLISTIVELVACVVLLKYHEPANYFIRRHFKHQLNEEYISFTSQDQVSMGWNLIMNEFHCCGVDGYLDFNSSFSYNESWYQPMHSVPERMTFDTAIACCNSIEIEPRLQQRFLLPCHKEQYINKKGCLSVFWEAVDEHKAAIGTCFTLTIVVQVATVFGTCLSRFQRESTVLPTKG